MPKDKMPSIPNKLNAYAPKTHYPKNNKRKKARKNSDFEQTVTKIQWK